MYRIGPISRKSNFHSREKCLIGLVLATLCIFCFGGIFLLPDNFGSERVLRAYKQFQKSGPEMFIPAPPLAAHAPKDSDPHFIGDRQKLQAKIKEELGELLDKPFTQKDVKYRDKNAIDEGNEMDNGLLDDQQQQGAVPPISDFSMTYGTPTAPVDETGFDGGANNLPVGNLNMPQMPQAKHTDSDPSVEEKRQKVKEVCVLKVFLNDVESLYDDNMMNG